MKKLFFLLSLFAAYSAAQNAGRVGIGIKTLKEGHGEPVKKNQLVQVHYTGWLADSTQFDNSRERNEPLEFVLGTGMVIKGWDIGIEGMKLGEVRSLEIPAVLAYGENAVGPIPANSKLLFEVELVGIEKSLEPDTLLNSAALKWKKLQPGIEIFDEKEGAGTELRAGMELTFHHTGWLTNGFKFGSSKNLGKPSKTAFGTGKLVRGLEVGLESIKQGGVRWLRISPSMAYGPVAMTSIPPNSTLIFRIQADEVVF